jgi:hypothetical protein
LRGGEVWRLTLPPAELARQDSAKKWRRTEVTGSDWTRSRYDWTRPVNGSNSQAWVARVLYRRVRSLAGLACPVRRPEGLQNVRG